VLNVSDTNQQVLLHRARAKIRPLEVRLVEAWIDTA